MSCMATSLRQPVEISQRQAVTDFRNNSGMTRPKDLQRFHHLGPRIRYWREKRQLTRTQLCDMVGLKYQTLADLEDERSHSTKFLYKFAQALRVNINYLETDEGDPEVDAPPTVEEWPLPGVPRERLADLDRTEKRAVEAALKEVLSEIEQDRRSRRKSG